MSYSMTTALARRPISSVWQSAALICTSHSYTVNTHQSPPQVPVSGISMNSADRRCAEPMAAEGAIPLLQHLDRRAQAAFARTGYCRRRSEPSEICSDSRVSHHDCAHDSIDPRPTRLVRHSRNRQQLRLLAGAEDYVRPSHEAPSTSSARLERLNRPVPVAV